MAEDDWESAADTAIATAAAAKAAATAAPKKAASQWEDEDAPEPAVEEPISKGPTPVPKKKALSAAKIAAKEREELKKAEAEAKARANDPKAAAAHKLAQIQLQKDSDKLIAAELFAGAGDDAPKREKRVGTNPLKDVELKTTAALDQFAKDLSAKVLPTESDKDKKTAVTFYKTALKISAAKFASDELREISAALTVLINEKIKEEGSSKKKKGGKAKAGAPLKSLNANANSSAVAESVAVSHDNTDEYDFL